MGRSSVINNDPVCRLFTVVIIVYTETVECCLRLKTKDLAFLVDSEGERRQNCANEMSAMHAQQ